VTVTGTGFMPARRSGRRGGGDRVTVVNDTDGHRHDAGTRRRGVEVQCRTDGADRDAGWRFTYVPAPTVVGVAPSAGPVEGGTTVVITGTGFEAGATVAFGGTDATGVTVTSAISITDDGTTRRTRRAP